MGAHKHFFGPPPPTVHPLGDAPDYNKVYIEWNLITVYF